MSPFETQLPFNSAMRKPACDVLPKLGMQLSFLLPCRSPAVLVRKVFVGKEVLQVTLATGRVRDARQAVLKKLNCGRFWVLACSIGMRGMPDSTPHP